jgi:hypothetical protein
MKLTYLAIAFSFFFVTCNSNAFIDPPVFVPSVVRSEESFLVFYRNGVCDSFPFVGFPIDIIQVPPNRVQIFSSGVHLTEPILCNQPTINPSFTIPALPAGEYQLELYVRNRFNPLQPTHNGPVTQFTVVGNPNVVMIPTLNVGGLLTLALGFLGLAWLTRRP